MHLPTSYCDHFTFPSEHASSFLEKYGHLLTYKNDRKEIIADIGCADGKTTTKILLPYLGEKVNEIVGIDISSAMLELAKKNNKNSMVSYVEMDAATKNLNPDMLEKFDHIFSFYCLHWIHDQRQCAENLYKMLKPGGEAFLTFAVRNQHFQCWFDLSQCTKWIEYVGNFPQFCSEYFINDEPIKLFESVFKEAGFAIEFIDSMKMSFTFTQDKFESAIRDVCVPLNSIPEELREEYIKDNIEMMYKLCNNTCTIEVLTVIAIVKKPIFYVENV